MFFALVDILKISLLIMVICNNVNGELSGEKTINLKIGFDITDGSNGPYLRMRNLEESPEDKQRDDVAKTYGTKPTVRADSFSGSADSSKEIKAHEHADRDSDNSKSESDDDYSGAVRYSTRGLNANEYDPEERAQVFKKADSSDSSSDQKNKRRKRNAFWKHFEKN